MILSPRDASWIKGINSRRPRLIASPNGREYDTLSTLSTRRFVRPAVPLDFYQPGDIRGPLFGVSKVAPSTAREEKSGGGGGGNGNFGLLGDL